MLTQERYLNETEAAEFLGLKPGTLRTWRSRPPSGGKSVPYRKFGSAVRYPMTKLLEWAELQK